MKLAPAPPVASLVLPLDTPPIAVDTDADEQSLAALLAHTEATWTRLGDEQPHWSVLSADRFKPDQVAAHRAEFDASGRSDVDVFLAFLARNGIDPHGFERILEYGCGVGRVTRFLTDEFHQVHACDISTSHLNLARTFLAEAGKSNVHFMRIRNLSDIEGEADVDAVFSVIVLQHNPPPVMVAVLERLLRRLRPGGVAYFQLPTHAADYHFSIADYLAHGLTAQHIEMHYLPQRHVFRIARDAGCDVLEVREDDWTGRRRMEISNTFLLQRR